MMIEQPIVHTLIGVVLTGFGWLIKVLWDSHKDLDEEVDTLKVAVAADYVKREELRSEFKAISAKLDRIEIKLDKKADK
jgi:hypothetical protein